MMESLGSYIASDRAEVEAARIAGASGARTAYLISDRAVATRAAALRNALSRAGVSVLGHTAFTGGERCKQMRSLENILNDLASAGADRATLVMAIGGGTVTDLAGFAAATYMRGVPWLPVATTVLGMVDASIGGKTGVDLPHGKNLAGVFWQPIGVVADLSALETLPARERRTGMAEIVKHAIIGDPGLLDVSASFAVGSADADWPSLIRRAADVKLSIVSRDPREAGARATLNLGHTVGHALEFVSGYRLSHGAAVAIGLRAAGLLALARGMWNDAAHARVLGALTHAGLALHMPTLRAAGVLAVMRKDKKRAAGKHRFVLPVRMGRVVAGIEVDEAAIRRVLATCSRPPSDKERAG